MLDNLYIKGTEDQPEVNFNRQKGIFRITGRSLPEDAGKFYDPVKRWIQEYKKNPNSYSEFIFKFHYFNSTSARKIASILLEIEKIHSKGKQVKIIWYFHESDEMMKDMGEDFKSFLNIPFEIKEYE